MNLFDDIDPATKTLLQLRDSAVGARQVMLAAVDNCEALIWKNPYGLKPEQVFAVLGSAGAEVLQLKAVLLPIFAASGGDQPKQLKPEGVKLTVTEAGNVSIEAVSVEV